MKKYILSVSIIIVLSFATQVKAQVAETYEDANSAINEVLNNPDVPSSDKEILKDLLKQNNAVLEDLKTDGPVYSGDNDPKVNEANYDHAPAALQPEPTKEINGSNNRSSGRTLISSQAN